MTVVTVMVMAVAVAVAVTVTVAVTVARARARARARAVTRTMMVVVMVVMVTVRLIIERGSRGCSRCYFRSLNIGWLLKHSRLEYITLCFRKRHRTLSTLLHLFSFLFLFFSLALLYILKLKPTSIFLLEEGHTSL